MSKFIELTESENKILLNVNWILSVEHHEKGALIKVGANGYGDNPCQYYYVSESYKEVKSLIFGSVHNIAE